MLHTKKQRRRRPTFWQRNGPIILTLIAAPLILADLVRHVLYDVQVDGERIWDWCGNNIHFPRVNQTWPSTCTWSSNQYQFNQPCCVPAGGLFEESGGVPDWMNETQIIEEYNIEPLAEADWPLGPDGEPKCYCPCAPENMGHLSMIGIIFTIGFTYLGFALLSIGVMWNANIVKKFAKIKTQWKELRGQM